MAEKQQIGKVEKAGKAGKAGKVGKVRRVQAPKALIQPTSREQLRYKPITRRERVQQTRQLEWRSGLIEQHLKQTYRFRRSVVQFPLLNQTRDRNGQRLSQQGPVHVFAKHLPRPPNDLESQFSRSFSSFL
jgi:hypothetical protein